MLYPQLNFYPSLDNPPDFLIYPTSSIVCKILSRHIGPCVYLRRSSLIALVHGPSLDLLVCQPLDILSSLVFSIFVTWVYLPWSSVIILFCGLSSCPLVCPLVPSLNVYLCMYVYIYSDLKCYNKDFNLLTPIEIE